MKLAIIGATGKLGTLLTDEALKQKIDVTALIRDHKKLIQDIPFIEKDIFDLTSEDILDFDVVISAYGAPQNNPKRYMDVTEHLIDMFKNTKTRLIIIGGASSLYTDETRSVQLTDSPLIPDFLKPIVLPMVDALKKYQESSINWTFFSPAMVFDAKGPFTYDTIIGSDVVLYNNHNHSYLTYPDAAQIVIEEVINNRFSKKRFTAASNE